jgi:uncharacterized membrane protein
MSLVYSIVGSLSVLILFVSGILSSLSAYKIGKDPLNSTNVNVKNARTLMIAAAVIIWIGFIATLIMVGAMIFSGVGKPSLDTTYNVLSKAQGLSYKLPSVFVAPKKGGEYILSGIKGAGSAISSFTSILPVILGSTIFLFSLIGFILAIIAYYKLRTIAPSNSEAKSGSNYALTVAILLGINCLIGIGLIIYYFVSKRSAKSKLEQLESQVASGENYSEGVPERVIASQKKTNPLHQVVTPDGAAYAVPNQAPAAPVFPTPAPPITDKTYLTPPPAVTDPRILKYQELLANPLSVQSSQLSSSISDALLSNRSPQVKF